MIDWDKHFSITNEEVIEEVPIPTEFPKPKPIEKFRRPTYKSLILSVLESISGEAINANEITERVNRELKKYDSPLTDSHVISKELSKLVQKELVSRAPAGKIILYWVGSPLK